MFTRTPGTVRPVDQDGEEDPPIEPVLSELPLTTETGIVLTDEDGNPLLV